MNVSQPLNNGSLQFITDFYRIGVPILCLTALLSLLLNLYILLSAKWICKKISPNLLITLSLAAVDSTTAALFIVGLILNSYLPAVYNLPMIELNCFRLFLESLRLGAAFTSVIHLLFLSINQLISIVYPLHYRTLVTRHRVKLFLLFVWISPFVCLNLLFSVFKGQGYRSNNCWSEFLIQFHFRLTLFLVVLIPFIAVVAIHIVLVRLLDRMKSFAEVEVCAKPKIRKSTRAAKTTFSIIVTFAVGWLPGSLLLIVVCHNCVVKISTVPTTILTPVATASNALIVVKLLINPLIYAFRVTEIRYALWLMHKQKFGWAKTRQFRDDIPVEFLKLTDSSHVLILSRRNSPISNNNSNQTSPRQLLTPDCWDRRVSVDDRFLSASPVFV